MLYIDKVSLHTLLASSTEVLPLRFPVLVKVVPVVVGRSLHFRCCPASVYMMFG